jgi:hypothetical protein
MIGTSVQKEATLSCGHQGLVKVSGNSKAREDKIRWAKEHQLCGDCYKIELAEAREKANATAAAEAKENGLPQLIGSEKQIAWATTIRKNKLEEIDAMMLTPTGDHLRAIEKIKSQTSAKVWIDNREISAYYLLQGVALRFETLDTRIKETVEAYPEHEERIKKNAEYLYSLAPGF